MKDIHEERGLRAYRAHFQARATGVILDTLTAEHRAHPRRDLRLDVSITVDGRRIEATTGDLSLGGMRIRISESLQYGTQVQVQIVLPALRSETTIDAVVRWTDENGMGLQFGALRAAQVWAINRLLSESGDRERSDRTAPSVEFEVHRDEEK